MRQITRTCPLCTGMNTLMPNEVRVDHWPAQEEPSTYTFTCAHCRQVITCPAALEVLALLACTVGVDWREHVRPSEVCETHDGPPLSLDDLIDFVMALRSTPDPLILQLAGD